jgi:hypothetical protein
VADIVAEAFAGQAADPRGTGRYLGLTSGLQSLKKNIARCRDLVPLDGKHKKGQLYTPLAISSAPEEVV